MKILKKLLLLIGIVFALFVVLVIVCAFRPDLTERIANFLYPDRRAAMEEADREPEQEESLLPVGMETRGTVKRSMDRNCR